MRLLNSRFAVFTVIVWAVTAVDLHAAPLSSAFTYQGQLKLVGIPLTGTVDLEVSLYDVDSGGVSLNTLALTNVSVVNGLFTVDLDFGVVAFNGDARWLEIAVRSPSDPGDTNAFTTLTPRQPLTATPYALQTNGLFVDDNGDVGVGTDAPAARLHVNGDLAFSLGQADMRIQEVDPSDPRFFGMINFFGIGIGSNTGANRQMVMVTDGFSSNPIFTVASSVDSGNNWLPRLAVTQSGNVGIGTSTPAHPLTVEGSGARNIYTRNSLGHGIQGDSDDPNSAGVVGLNLSGGIGVRGETSNSGGYAGYFQGGRNYFSGNVGIGVVAPTSPLHVVAQEGNVIVGHATGTATSVKTAGVAGFAEPGSLNSGTYGQLGTGTGSSPFGGAAVFGSASSGNGVAGTTADAIGRGVQGVNESTTGVARGVLGISASEIGQGVFAKATHVTGTNFALRASTNSPNGYAGYFEGGRNYFGGNLGIGTTSPNFQLSLGDTLSHTKIALYETSPTNHYGMGVVGGQFSFHLGGSGARYAFYDSADLTNEVFTIQGTGNVGIGTSLPLGKLDVNGSIYQRGGSLHADYVFGSEYELESIEDHSTFMWSEGHLPAVPQARKDEKGREIVEVSSHRRGILEELEKAHIYIERLNAEKDCLAEEVAEKDKRLSVVESKLLDDAERLTRLEELVMKLSQDRKGEER